VVCQEAGQFAISYAFTFIRPPSTGVRIRSEGQVRSLALVKLRDNESFEQAFRRFKKSCEKSGILSEVKKREHYEKPSVRLKKKSISARKRLVKKMKKQQTD
jgi:small subunit ribosomal protein S21